MSNAQYINPQCLAAPPGNFSWMTRSGNIVWLAGMVGIDKSGNIVGVGDAEAQTRQVYANVEAQLKEIGGSLNNLVKTVTYVVGREHVPGMARVRGGLRSEGKMTNMPASTLLIVAGLQDPDYLVEMDAVAVIG